MTSSDVFFLIRERVARGVAWLENQDVDWFSKVNLDSFDIVNPRYCILGQVFKDKSSLPGYDYAFETLGMLDYSSYGFDADYEIKYDYNGLTREWKRVLGNSFAS